MARLFLRGFLSSLSPFPLGLSFVYSPLSYTHRWNNLVPLELDFFGWRVVLNRLPSKSELSKRGVVLPSVLCAACGSVEETVTHLLWQCSWVKESPLHVNISHAVTLSALWAIWKARNERSFNNANSSPAKVLDDIKTNSFQWIKNRSKGFVLNWDLWCSFPFAVP
ncbi:hypothetical protein LXL04_019654 [Taraxacum kok-saghyz]